VMTETEFDDAINERNSLSKEENDIV
jgi:hypothetical protein